MELLLSKKGRINEVGHCEKLVWIVQAKYVESTMYAGE